MHRYVFRMTNLMRCTSICCTSICCTSSLLTQPIIRKCCVTKTCRHLLTVTTHRPQIGCIPSQYIQHFNFRFITRLYFLLRFRRTFTHFTTLTAISRNCLASCSRSSITTYNLLATVMPSVGYMRK